MKLSIVYSKDRDVRVENVKYITVFHTRLYYYVGEDPSVCIVDLKDVAFFSMIE